MFPKLLEMLPDADSLLRLEPEELAGPLLVSLEGDQKINPVRVIAHDHLSRSFKIGQNCGKNTHPKHNNEILFRLMEAWQWLEMKALLRSDQLVSHAKRAQMQIKYFVTRRGQEIETTEDLAAYRKENLLPKDQLHPIIAEKVWSLFLRGDYDTAVFQGFKEIEIAVRKAGGYADTDRGVDLMRRAFDVKTGKLTDLNQQKAEQEARSHLFAGAIGSYKNPGSHRDVDVTAEEAAE